MKNLLAKGMIVFEEKQDKGRNKKVYSITTSGRDAFYQWMLDEIPVNKLEVTALSKVYFLGLMPDVNQRRHIVLEILRKIETVQGQLVEMNAAISQIEVPEAYREILKYQLMTLDYGLKAHVFAREWFQALLENL